MSSSSKKDSMATKIDNETTEIMVLISPNDVKNYLKKNIWVHRVNVQAGHINVMKKWIISRPATVVAYQCFIFLGIHCSIVTQTLTFEQMKSLIDCMILLVSLCVSNSKIIKTKKSEKIDK